METVKLEGSTVAPVPVGAFAPLTWFPAYWSFLSAAEANFAKDVEDVSLTQRPRVFTGTRASLVGGDLVAVGLAGLALLSDQGAGDSRRHLPDRWAEPQRTAIPAVWSESEVAERSVPNRRHAARRASEGLDEECSPLWQLHDQKHLIYCGKRPAFTRTVKKPTRILQVHQS